MIPVAGHAGFAKLPHPGESWAAEWKIRSTLQGFPCMVFGKCSFACWDFSAVLSELCFGMLGRGKELETCGHFDVESWLKRVQVIPSPNRNKDGPYYLQLQIILG